MRHVVWDWNGTLLDDLHVVVAAVNAVMADLGHDPITADDYRTHYTRPVHRFYERLFGRPIPDDEWPHLDDVFHVAYAAALAEARLVADAHAALDRVAHAGATQSLLSMYRHRELVPLVRAHGLDERFVRVDGLRGAGGGRKATYLAAHLRQLDLLDHADEVLVIGDAVDDAHAAAHVGARCVLFDGGSHPHDELAATGVPVTASLVDAVALAGL